MSGGQGDAAPIPALPNEWLKVIHAIAVEAMTAQSDPHAEAQVYRKALIGICNMALKAQSALVPSSQPETPTPWEHTRCYNCGSPAVDHPNSGYCANRDGGLRCEKFVALPVVQDEAPKAATVVERISMGNNSIRYRLDGHDETIAFSTVNDANKVWELLRRIYVAGASRPSPARSLVDQSTLDRIDANLAGVNGLAPHITIEDARFLRALVGRPPVEKPRYGCKQCQSDFNHDPLTWTIPGIPARTYFFCSPECRERWLMPKVHPVAENVKAVGPSPAPKEAT